MFHIHFFIYNRNFQILTLEILHHFTALMVSFGRIEDKVKINFLEEQEPHYKMISYFFCLEFV